VSGRPVVTLYGRDGCHLCDEARAEILALRAELPPFDLDEVDIESDDGLHAALLERIPVVEVDGALVCELGLDRSALARAVAGASPDRARIPWGR
jgi:glutaredoxin-like protein DUF836